ncbi:MAG: hypothetical protein J0G32_08180 [Alphaproteobacteria bacterium]|nr:hypothetical protein [Alphaproteobacteria bacterium]OJV15298.1 MAG: hypothetical protein BGO27_02185 [Alphaproteobacteria bacterium 33-17]
MLDNNDKVASKVNSIMFFEGANDSLNRFVKSDQERKSFVNNSLKKKSFGRLEWYTDQEIANITQIKLAYKNADPDNKNVYLDMAQYMSLDDPDQNRNQEKKQINTDVKKQLTSKYTNQSEIGVHLVSPNCIDLSVRESVYGQETYQLKGMLDKITQDPLLKQADSVRIPINYKNHWITLVVKPKEHKFELYDGLGRNYPRLNKLLKEYKSKGFENGLKTIKGFQNDTYSCGPFCSAVLTSDKVNLEPHDLKGKGEEFRMQYVYDILRGEEGAKDLLNANAKQVQNIPAKIPLNDKLSEINSKANPKPDYNKTDTPSMLQNTAKHTDRNDYLKEKEALKAQKKAERQNKPSKPSKLKSFGAWLKRTFKPGHKNKISSVNVSPDATPTNKDTKSRVLKK